MNPTGCPVHSALQGWRGLTSPRQRPSGDQWELRKSILHRCTRQKKEESSLTWQMSPERRNLVPGETINSSLQWLSEGLRASAGPAGEKCGQHLLFVFGVSGGSGVDVVGVLSQSLGALCKPILTFPKLVSVTVFVEGKKRKTHTEFRRRHRCVSPSRPPSCLSGSPQPRPTRGDR